MARVNAATIVLMGIGIFTVAGIVAPHVSKLWKSAGYGGL
jgi:hypothetical protein